MKNLFNKRYIVLFTASLVSATSLISQFDNTDFLMAGTVDGPLLTGPSVGGINPISFVSAGLGISFR